MLLLCVVVVALVDWWAVASERRRVELVAKPATMLLLVAVAATLGDVAGDVRIWLVVGAALGVVGDTALLDDGEPAFLVGLTAFAFGHLAYAVAAAHVAFDPVWAVAGAVTVGGLLAFRFATRTVPGARRHGGAVLAGAVVAYAAIISAMVVTAWASRIALAALGATLFAISDWVLGHERFVGPVPGHRLSVMIPYHVGQALLIIGLATA